MSLNSKIEWTDTTWNPVRGCTKISAGCKNCYAERFAERFRGVKGHPFGQGFDLRLVPEKLSEPLRWADPRMIFVNSMSDLFHKRVPDAYIEKVTATMQLANWHTYQVLTKRAGRMKTLLSGLLLEAAAEPHIWWGVSVENKQHGACGKNAHPQQRLSLFRILKLTEIDSGHVIDQDIQDSVPLAECVQNRLRWGQRDNHIADRNNDQSAEHCGSRQQDHEDFLHKSPRR